MRKWAIWIPVLMVASLLYWTVALGLGGLSLFAVTALDCGPDAAGAGQGAGSAIGAMVSDSYTPITVNIVDPMAAADDDGDEADDNTGVTVDLVEDPTPAPPATDRNGPGATAF